MELKAIVIIDRLMMAYSNRLLKKTGYALLYGVFVAHSLTAQDYTYTHYDVKNGLAGSTVYDLCQDKEGFMWFATEAGVSRFDGTHFKNFTTAEGLPETEILKLFPDSKGKIWMSPFKHAVCYYYKGKIYTSQNDSLLAKIAIKEVIVNFTEDADKNVALSTGGSVYVITDSSVHKLPFRHTASLSLGFAPDIYGKGIHIRVNDSIFTWYQGQFTFQQMAVRGGVDPVFQKGCDGKMPSPKKITTVEKSPGGKNFLFVNTFS
jgi:ligand-binding sensor domain-containing protein